MLNKALFNRTLHSGYKLWLIFAAVLAMYSILIIGMYEPDINKTMGALMATLPPEMMSAFGFNMTDTTLTGFLSSYLYGFLMLVFPMIYEIILANRLIAGYIDNGSMAYLIATPHKRYKIAVTQAIYLLVSLVLLIGFVTGLGIICANTSFPGSLDLTKYILLNVGALCLHIYISGIGFLATCISNDTKLSLTIGAGIPIAFYLLNMLANMGGKLEKLKYVTVFSLFDTTKIMSGDQMIIPMLLILLTGGLVLYVTGIVAFAKRDLPI